MGHNLLRTRGLIDSVRRGRPSHSPKMCRATAVFRDDGPLGQFLIRRLFLHEWHELVEVL
jgi:hypothetical protein